MDMQESIAGFRPDLFPKDFPERLEGLKQLSGLLWKEFSARLGVKHGRVKGWRGGVRPRGEALWAIMRLVHGVPGGIETMLPEDSGGAGGAK